MFTYAACFLEIDSGHLSDKVYISMKLLRLHRVLLVRR